MKRSTVILDGRVRPVPVGELNRHASRVLGSLSDGERLVVTRHGDPVAVVMPVREAIEILVAPAFARFREAAEAAFEADEVFEPWPEAGPWRIVLPRAFERRLARLGGRDRGGLRRALAHGDARGAPPRERTTSCPRCAF
jgi:prevent-host-death family protein